MFFKPNAKKLLSELEKNSSMDAYRRITDDLHSLGTKQPAELINLLTAENAATIGDAISDSGEKGLILLFDIIKNAVNPLRVAALRALWEFEEAATSRLDAIVELIDDPEPEIRYHAVHAIARMREGGLPAGLRLVRVALEGAEKERTSAFFGLRQMQYDPTILQEVCREVLFSEAPWKVKHSAIDCIQKCGIDPAPFIIGVIEFVENSQGDFATPELDILGMYEFDDETTRLRAVRAIERRVSNKSIRTSQTLETLWKIDPGNEVVFSAIEEMLSSGDSDLESACDAICELGEQGARFVPLLVQKLDEYQGYWDFCWAAVDALNRIGPAAIAAKPMLEQLLQHPSELVQARATLAIASVEGRPIPEDEE